MADAGADPSKIRRLAQETGYQIGPLEKAVRLTTFLSAMSKHRHLREDLVLKGGTALNVYHGNLERLSVDADLNYVGATTLEGLKENKEALFRRIEDVAQEFGYDSSLIRDDHALRAYRLDYVGANGNKDLIKLDINLIERVPLLLPLDERTPPTTLEVESEPVPCLRRDELAGSKLATAMVRDNCRDLFDVAQLSKEPTIDWDLVRKVGLFHGLMDDLHLDELDPRRPENLTQQEFNRDVRNLLPKRNDVTLARLKQDALPRIKALFPLTGNEQACQKGLLEGTWEPELLFEKHEVNPDVVDHPGILWRLERQADM